MIFILIDVELPYPTNQARAEEKERNNMVRILWYRTIILDKR
jgi:hypothetical protein